MNLDFISKQKTSKFNWAFSDWLSWEKPGLHPRDTIAAAVLKANTESEGGEDYADSIPVTLNSSACPFYRDSQPCVCHASVQQQEESAWTWGLCTTQQFLL